MKTIVIHHRSSGKAEPRHSDERVCEFTAVDETSNPSASSCSLARWSESLLSSLHLHLRLLGLRAWCAAKSHSKIVPCVSGQSRALRSCTIHVRVHDAGKFRSPFVGRVSCAPCLVLVMVLRYHAVHVQEV